MVLNWKTILTLVLVLATRQVNASMPDELYRGMVQYEIESGNSLRALSLMDEKFKRREPVSYASALQGLNIHILTTELLDAIDLKDKSLSESDYFNIGKAQYREDRCIHALKAFKNLKNKLGLEQKQEWAYYRANCFIKLGSNARAAQVLSSDLLSGTWIAYAYYNLAIAYAEASTNKRKAIAVLLIAESLNEGKTAEERELNDKIHLAAGRLYLEEGQVNKAIESFNKVQLDSPSSAAALYLRGVSHLEANDFRAATQSWTAVKSYSLLQQGVAESFLAIPFAYERSGYVMQAMESYAAASSVFSEELETIDKVEALIKKHGANKVFFQREVLKGLEWFLSKDVATNTLRASYYSYLMAEPEIFRQVELYMELKTLKESMGYWQDQLAVLGSALNKKSKDFNKTKKSLNFNKVQARLRDLEKREQQLKNKALAMPNSSSLKLDEIPPQMTSIGERIDKLKARVKQGKGIISDQIQQKKRLGTRITKAQKKLDKLMDKLEDSISEKMLLKLKEIRIELTFNYERAEQGLVHILETAAEISNRKRQKRKLNDGLYQ